VNHENWHADGIKQLLGQKKIPNNTFLTYTFFAPDKRKGDISNKLESVNDLLVDCGILEDDNWFVLGDYRVKFGGIDRLCPRVEIQF